MYARDGKMLGGNSAFAHIGSYEKRDDGVDIVMTREQAAAYGTEFARFMRIFAYVDPADRTMVISVDNSRFMNHADEPNTGWDERFGWATRDIRKGEEITCDYYTFWFEPPFASPSE